MRARKTRVRRIALSALGLILAAAAGWLVALPGARLEAAHANTAATEAPRPALRIAHRRLGGIPLETLLNAQNRLNTAEVRDTHHNTVGEVRDVVVGRGGQPRIVRVAFGGFLGFGERIVSLEADRLAYDPLHNVVLTDMTERDLEGLAAQHRTREARAD